MSRTVVISLGFMNADIIENSFAQLYSTRNFALTFEHHVLDQHYPLNKDYNRDKLDQLCAKYGIKKHDAGKNLGLHDGINYVMQKLDLKDSDIVIGYDPDSFPLRIGWDMALVRVLQRDPQTVWASLMSDRARVEMNERGYTFQIVDFDIRVWKVKTAVVNSVCAWKYGWLKSVGFLTEPFAFYGGLECDMWNKLRGKHWAFLEEYPEDDRLRHEHDKLYVEYKWAHAHLRTWKGDFESWLAAGAPLPNREEPIKLP